ncbi:MAG: gliding motility-associated C-terminal domain-containing protein [Elusimicrobiota bacterium]
MKKSGFWTEFQIKWHYKNVFIIVCFLILSTIFYNLLVCTCLFSAEFKIVNVRPKVITPNNDGKNDMLIISYKNPNDSNVSGRILTLSGSYISDMLNGNSNKITWEGKNADDSIVPSGIYIYQIEVEGQVFHGTVVVAK